MEKKRSVGIELELLLDHMRLLSSALEKRTRMLELDEDAFAQVLKDLANRLEHLGLCNRVCTCTNCPKRES